MVWLVSWAWPVCGRELDSYVGVRVIPEPYICVVTCRPAKQPIHLPSILLLSATPWILGCQVNLCTANLLPCSMFVGNANANEGRATLQLGLHSPAFTICRCSCGVLKSDELHACLLKLLREMQWSVHLQSIHPMGQVKVCCIQGFFTVHACLLMLSSMCCSLVTSES